MNPIWKKYLSATVPRYTSYPSALQFDDLEAGSRRAALDRIDNYDPISLYIHIPFCAKLCWYCGCNMRVENRYERASRYTTALVEEIRQVAATMAGRGRLTQLHFGGGTPNYLSAEDLARILDAVEIGFGLTDGTPVAMEFDPRLMNEKQIAAFTAMGVNRASLGIQDFDPFVQTAINRVQSFELIDACVAHLREAGVTDVGFDLLYGLPRQKEQTFRETLRKTVHLGPDRISLFGYAHIPDRLRHQRLIDPEDLPDPGCRSQLRDMAAEAFQEAGYLPIGFDHFARPDAPIARAMMEHRLNRNFQGFTEDPANIVIGFGASAISSFPALHAQNEKDIAAYSATVLKGADPAVRGTNITPRDQKIGAWIKRLLCTGEARLSDYAAVLDLQEADLDQIRSRLDVFVRDGVVSLEGDHLRIGEEARVLARTVAAVFDPYVKGATSFASLAV